MEYLDIDRLHDSLDKNCDRTTKMLVEAVQHVDFMEEYGSVHIIVHSDQFANLIKEEIISIALNLGFEHIKCYCEKRVDINNVMFLIHTSKEPKNIESEYANSRSVWFVDHFVLEKNNG